MPCNGLMYVPPHPCQCFNDIKFDGFHAFAAGVYGGIVTDEQRVPRGIVHMHDLVQLGLG